MASVTWTGLTELIKALQELPDRLTEEAKAIVASAADDVQAAVTAEYHRVSGELRRGVKKIEQSAGRYGVAYQVRSTAYHAWMIENGTVARHTRKGVVRGIQPPQHIMIPAAVRRRVRMYRELKGMLLREGLIVSGDV
jgi:hypothetical protein